MKGKNTSITKVDYIILLTFCAVILVWYLPLMNRGIIMGDDIGIVLSARRLGYNLRSIFGYSGGDKYRPVFGIVALLEGICFDNNYEYYFVFNLALTAISVALIYYLSNLVSNKNRVLSFFLTVLFITSPYSYYNVMQLTGSMEALANILLLLTALFLINYWRGEKKNLYYSSLFATLTVFTHERYIVLTPILITAVVLNECVPIKKSEDKKRWRGPLLRIMTASIPLTLQVILKKAVFSSHILTGTGGTYISLNFAQVLLFFCCGVLCFLGVVAGPPYLQGYTVFDYSVWQFAVALFAVAIVAFAVTKYVLLIIKYPRDKRNIEIKTTLLFCVSICAILLSGCVTIRLESRWIFSAQIIYLLFLSYLFSNTFSSKKYCNSIAVALTAFLVVINIAVWKYGVDRIYFSTAMQSANSFYNVTIEEYGEKLKDYDLYIVGNTEVRWAVGSGNNSIFDVYNVFPNSFSHYDSEEEATKAIFENGKDPNGCKLFLLREDLSIEEKALPKK